MLGFVRFPKSMSSLFYISLSGVSCWVLAYELGAVRYQEQESMKRVINYGSRGLNKAEKKFHHTRENF
jgi:hypothetical protein